MTLTSTQPRIQSQEPKEPTVETTATPAQTTERFEERPNKVRTFNVIRGEWIKFWTVRSTSVTLVAAGLATVMFGMIFSAVAGSDEQAGPAALLTDPVDVALGGVGLTEMIVGVLGVLVVAGEYSTGLIRTTMAAVGSRTRVVWSKVAVVASTVFAMGLFAATAAVWLGQSVYAGSEATVAITEVTGVIIGTAVYLAGIALIGVALGFILRSTAGAIGTLIGGVFIGPNLLNLLPESFTDATLKYLPSEAGASIMARVSDPSLLSQGTAYVVFTGWVVGLLLVAQMLVNRKDA